MQSKRSFGRALVVAAAVIAAPLSCLASDGTITVSGQVTSETCTTITNSGGQTAGPIFTVKLPTVSAATITNTGTAGLTKFSLLLSGCTITASGTNSLFAYFEPNSSVNAQGRLSSGLTNVDIELLNASGTTAINLGAASGSQNSTTAQVTTSTTSATLTYYAQYRYAGSGTVGTGLASASINYTIVYP
jgi:major type 1 subunit fimbrin (pilin)